MDARILSAVDRAESLAVSLKARIGAERTSPDDDSLRFPPGPARRPGKVLGSIGYYLRFATDPIRFVGERFRTYGDLYYAPGPDGHLFAPSTPPISKRSWSRAPRSSTRPTAPSNASPRSSATDS